MYRKNSNLFQVQFPFNILNPTLYQYSLKTEVATTPTKPRTSVNTGEGNAAVRSSTVAGKVTTLQGKTPPPSSWNVLQSSKNVLFEYNSSMN